MLAEDFFSTYLACFFQNVQCCSPSYKIVVTRVELMRCRFSAKQTHRCNCCTCSFPLFAMYFDRNGVTASRRYIQDSKKATTQKRKDERSAQNRSDAMAKRLMVLTVGIVDAVVLSNQFFQVLVTDWHLSTILQRSALLDWTQAKCWMNYIAGC